MNCKETLTALSENLETQPTNGTCGSLSLDANLPNGILITIIFQALRKNDDHIFNDVMVNIWLRHRQKPQTFNATIILTSEVASALSLVFFSTSLGCLFCLLQ